MTGRPVVHACGERGRARARTWTRGLLGWRTSPWAHVAVCSHGLVVHGRRVGRQCLAWGRVERVELARGAVVVHVDGRRWVRLRPTGPAAAVLLATLLAHAPGGASADT